MVAGRCRECDDRQVGHAAAAVFMAEVDATGRVTVGLPDRRHSRRGSLGPYREPHRLIEVRARRGVPFTEEDRWQWVDSIRRSVQATASDPYKTRDDREWLRETAPRVLFVIDEGPARRPAPLCCPVCGHTRRDLPRRDLWAMVAQAAADGRDAVWV